jgi:preprotein translocase subunit SecD
MKMGRMTMAKMLMPLIAALAILPPLHAQVPAATLSLGVEQAQVQKDARSGAYLLQITLTPESKASFAQFTTGHVGQQLALKADGITLASPTIAEPITTGEATLSPGVGDQGIPPSQLNAIAKRLMAGQARIEVSLPAAKTTASD